MYRLFLFLLTQLIGCSIPDLEKEEILKEAKKEVSIGKDFNQVIVNDNFTEALADLKNFIFSDNLPSRERQEISRNSLNLLLD